MSCPDAPVRKRRQDVFEDHYDLGILAGDFIKPDPIMTRRETQTYLLDEIHHWLTGRICEHAAEIHKAYEDGHRVDLVSYLSGVWPAARLYVLFRLLEKQHPQMKDGDPFRFVGEWAAKVCTGYLQGDIDEDDPTAMLAVGFVAADELPCGRTIESFWNHSPFEALRNAPPLTDEEDEDDDDEHIYAPLEETEYDCDPPLTFIIVVFLYLWAICTAFLM